MPNFFLLPKKTELPKIFFFWGGGGGLHPPSLPRPYAYELSQTVKGLQTKVSYTEIYVVAVKEKWKSPEEDCSHMKEDAKFIDEKITELQENVDKRNEISREEEGTSADILDNSVLSMLEIQIFLRRQSNRYRSIHCVCQQN